MRAGALGAVGSALLTRVNARVLPRPVAPGRPVTGRVVVGVPARDEARRLPGLLADLAGQTGLADLVVLVLDDGSTDATADVVRAAGRTDPRVRLLTGTPLPPGWLGKPHACAQLADAAAGLGADDLVLVDADVRLTPDALAACVALRRRLGVALLSPWPRQVAGSPLERLVQPVQQWSWLSTVPLAIALRSTRPAFAAANGQLLVLDPAAHRAVGGHGSVAGEVVEDVALARVLRRAGHRTTPADGSRHASCRMYDDAAALRAGYGKSLGTALGPLPAAMLVLGGLVGVHVLPAVGALLGSGRTRAWGAVGVAAAVDSRAVAARLAGTPVWPDSAAHPVSVLAVVALWLDSRRARRRGTLSWKGRPLA